MSKLLNYANDALRLANGAVDDVPRIRKSLRSVPGQLSMFDDVPKFKLAGASKGKAFYQPGLANLYDTLQAAPNSALQSAEYLDYVNSLSNSQVEDLIPQGIDALISAQTRQPALQSVQALYDSPETRDLAELLSQHIK